MKRNHVIEWLLLVVMVVLTTLSIVALNAANTANHNTKAIRAAAIAQCQRLQEQRNEDNSTAFRQKQVVTLLAHTLENPGILGVLDQPDRQLRVNDVRILKAEADAILYQPPTNCIRAVELGTKYKRPAKTQFPANFQP